MKKNSIRKVISIILVFVLAFGMMSVGLAAGGSLEQLSEPGVLEIYITPNGDKDITSNGKIESNAGTRSNPVFSLEQAEQIVKAKDAEYQLSRKMQTKALDDSSLEPVEAVEKISKVNVHIGRGKYVGQRIKWEKMPDDMTINVIGEEGAVFEGGGTGTFMEIDNTETNTVYNISNLNVENYDEGLTLCDVSNSTIIGGCFADISNYGISIIGSGTVFPDVVSNQIDWTSHDTTISGTKFINIGNGHGQKGLYAALRLKSACRNTITNCKFINIENTIENKATLHAIYLANGSSNNQITNCGFQNVTGDAIRIRHASHNNTVSGCTFKKSGYTAYCSDWFDKYDPNKPGTSDEFQSKGNKFINNKVQSGQKGYYNNSYFQNIVIFIWGGGTSDIGPANPDRLLESGTVSTNVPDIS